MAEPMFPIMKDDQIKALPWWVMALHEKQARSNHSQSLETLARRGGLTIEEAYCVLADREIRCGSRFDLTAVRVALMQIVQRAHKQLSADQEGPSS